MVSGSSHQCHVNTTLYLAPRAYKFPMEKSSLVHIEIDIGPQSCLAERSRRGVQISKERRSEEMCDFRALI